MRLNVSALIWRTLASWLRLQMIWSKPLLDAVQGCLLGRVTGPWDFVQTLQGKQSAPQCFQIGCILISCKGGSTLVFYDQMLNIGAEFLVFIMICKSWLFLITLDSLLISTLDCKFFVPFMIFFLTLYGLSCVWYFKCEVLLAIQVSQRTEVVNKYYFYLSQVPESPLQEDYVLHLLPFRLVIRYIRSLLLIV